MPAAGSSGGAGPPGADADAGRRPARPATAPAHCAGAAPAASGETTPSKGSVTGAYVVGGIGLVAGLAALALAATGRRRRTTVDRNREPASTSTGAQ